MLHRTLRAAALASTMLAAALAAPLAARAGPITGYPAASTPLAGTETVIGNQSPTGTVQFTTASIAAINYSVAGTWTQPQTFPAPGAGVGSIVLTPGSVSGSPANGSLWTTTGGLFGRINGATQQFAILGANTFTGTQTLPDGGTLTSTLNTLAKPVYFSGTTGGFEVNGSGSFFPCLYSSAANQGALGFASSAGGACGNPVLSWLDTSGTASLTLTAPTLDGTTRVADSTGASTVATFSWVGGTTPTWTLPYPGVIKLAGSAFSSDGASGSAVDLGSGAQGDKTGTLNLATLSAATQVNLPSVTGLQTSEITTAHARLGQPLLFVGPKSFLSPTTGQSVIQEGGVQTGSNGTLGLSIMGTPPASAGLYCDQYSSYCTGRQVDFISSDNFGVFGVETGARDNHSLSIGQVRSSDSMLHMSQLFFTDEIMPNGAIQHYVIDTPGSLYTAATASLSGGTCSVAPTAPVVYISGGAVVGLGAPVPGVCSVAPTVTIAGDGSGATAHATLVSGVTDALVGPTELWISLNSTGAGSNYGLGQCDVTHPRCLWLGNALQSTGSAWDGTASLQPTFGTAGHIVFGTANGAGNTGFTWGEQLSDSGGILQVQNGALSAAAGVKLAFVRLVPTTVAGLAAADPSPADGDRASVTDATACTFASALTGGGSTHCGARYDSSAAAWVGG